MPLDAADDYGDSWIKKDADLSRGDAGVVEPDHELVGDASCGKRFEQQVCTVVLGSAHQQAGTLHCPVHLSGYTTHR